MDSAHAFKGVPELLMALRFLPGAHALLVGDGDLRPKFEQQAHDLNIASRVHFLGRTDDATKVDALRTADVFAFPSTRPAEAFGLVALEAMACGVPVVASDLPGVRTVVQQGKTGWLVRPGSVTELVTALEKVVSSDARRREMGEAARSFAVDRFSWDRHVDGLMDTYQRVCASPY
jgi:glycosyltransferase involved in cell wall biosynthesis